jgi:hypothetical protein
VCGNTHFIGAKNGAELGPNSFDKTGTFQGDRQERRASHSKTGRGSSQRAKPSSCRFTTNAVSRLVRWKKGKEIPEHILRTPVAPLEKRRHRTKSLVCSRRPLSCPKFANNIG